MAPLLEEDPEGIIAQVASQDITIAANADFLEKYNTINDISSKALTYMQEEETSAYNAAIQFLQNYEELWVEWVPEHVAEKVKDAI